MMKNGVIIGAAFGMIIGALLVNNNQRVRDMVEDTQQRVMAKVQQCKDSAAQKGCCCSGEDQNADSQNAGQTNMQSDYMN